MKMITLTSEYSGTKYKVNPLAIVEVWPGDRVGSSLYLSNTPEPQAVREDPDTIATLFREATQIEHQNPYR